MKCDMGRAMTHQFNSEVAVKLGVNAAIIIANLAYLQHNRQAQGGEKYYMDERWWVHHTYESLQKVHPYFSVQKIRRIMRDLVQQEAVFHCTPDKWRRDSYWSVAPEFLHVSESTVASVGIDSSQVSESTVVLHDNNIEHIYTRASMFDAWWKLYPRKAGKKRARKLFEKLSSSDLKDCLADNASLRYKGRSKEHIPQADTYLSQNKWEDEQDHASAQPKQRWL